MGKVESMSIEYVNNKHWNDSNILTLNNPLTLVGHTWIPEVKILKHDYITLSDSPIQTN